MHVLMTIKIVLNFHKASSTNDIALIKKKNICNFSPYKIRIHHIFCST